MRLTSLCGVSERRGEESLTPARIAPEENLKWVSSEKRIRLAHFLAVAVIQSHRSPPTLGKQEEHDSFRAERSRSQLIFSQHLNIDGSQCGK